MTSEPARIPVIIGVGQINDRPTQAEHGLDPVGLMAAALQRADEDAGGGWLGRADSLAVVDQLAMRHLNPVVGKVAQALDIHPECQFQTPMPMGDSPVMLLNEAANRIGAGEGQVALLVGAEALRTAAQLASAKRGDAASEHNALRQAAAAHPIGYRAKYGLSTPVDIYPLYENACRTHWGQTLAEGQQESAVIWSLFSQVAADNPNAWIRSPKTVEEIAAPGPDNRPIAFPYSKFMVANSSVNQGAAVIVTSLALAQAHSVPDDKLVYIGNGAAAHEPDDFLERDRYDHSVSMKVSLERALELNGLTIKDVDHAELYSCFPCVPKMARRIIGWPADRAASVFGGLTFGGGPIGNYMSHAIASMVDRLRAERGTGLLFANGGFATHNHSIVVSSTPIQAAEFPRSFDFQADADALRGNVPSLAKDYVGPGSVETYTVFYDRMGAPRFGLVVGRSPEDQRFLARIEPDDGDGIARLQGEHGDPIGMFGNASNNVEGMIEWHFS